MFSVPPQTMNIISISSLNWAFDGHIIIPVGWHTHIHTHTCVYLTSLQYFTCWNVVLGKCACLSAPKMSPLHHDSNPYFGNLQTGMTAYVRINCNSDSITSIQLHRSLILRGAYIIILWPSLYTKYRRTSDKRTFRIEDTIEKISTRVRRSPTVFPNISQAGPTHHNNTASYFDFVRSVFTYLVLNHNQGFLIGIWVPYTQTLELSRTKSLYTHTSFLDVIQ